MNFWRNWWRTIRALAVAAPGPFCLVGVGVLVGAAVPASEVKAFAGLIDAITGGAGWRSVGFWLGALGLIMAAEALTQRLVPVWFMRLAKQANLHFWGGLLERAARAPLLEFESPAFYDQFSQAQRGVTDYLTGTLESSWTLLSSAITVVSVLAVLAGMDWRAALVLVVVSGPAWFFQATMSTMQIRFVRSNVQRFRWLDYLGNVMTERRYAQELRLFGFGPLILQRWLADRRDIMAERLAMYRKRGLAQMAAMTLGDLGYVGALGFMGLGAIAGRLTIGAFSAAIKAAQDVRAAVLTFLFRAGAMIETGAFLADMWAFLDRPGSVQPLELPVSACPTADTTVVFEHVTFAYPGREQPVLADVTFTVAPGQLVALVGENGAGKSTLVKLLLGLYPPSGGRVAVGGAEPRSGSMAPVFQDYNRYSFTAGENIAVGDIAAADDRARIARAAAGSGADAVVAELPQGYDTQLGKEFDGGQELSGGQWQKLAIARAYMRGAPLLILDEPTAALDPLAEVEVFRRFRELARGRTAFFISHRLGAARLADRILVLKQGRLVEDGRHDELIARGGEYAALFAAQAAWYRDAAAD